MWVSWKFETKEIWRILLSPGNYMFSFSIFFLEAEKQRGVLVRDSSAVVRSAAVRYGAGTRGQHRYVRQRGEEGVSGWVKNKSNYFACNRFLSVSAKPRAGSRRSQLERRLFRFKGYSMRAADCTLPSRKSYVRVANSREHVSEHNAPEKCVLSEITIATGAVNFQGLTIAKFRRVKCVLWKIWTFWKALLEGKVVCCFNRLSSDLIWKNFW